MQYTNILQLSLILNLYLNSLITHSLFINYSGHGLWSPTMLTLSQQPHINFITKEKAGTQYIKRLHCCWTVGRFGGVCHGPLNVLLSLFAVFSNGDLLPQSSRVTLKGTQTSHSRDFDTTWTLKPYKLQCFWMKLDLSSFDLFIVPLVEMYISLNMWGFYFYSCIVALNEHGYEWTHFGNSWPVWTSFYLCLSVFNPANECICLFVNSLFKRDVHEKEIGYFFNSGLSRFQRQTRPRRLPGRRRLWSVQLRSSPGRRWTVSQSNDVDWPAGVLKQSVVSRSSQRPGIIHLPPIDRSQQRRSAWTF